MNFKIIADKIAKEQDENHTVHNSVHMILQEPDAHTQTPYVGAAIYFLDKDQYTQVSVELWYGPSVKKNWAVATFNITKTNIVEIEESVNALLNAWAK